MRTEREELAEEYSDTYKDLTGIRPRGEWMWTCPIEELRASVARLYEDLAEEIEREEAEGPWRAEEELDPEEGKFPSEGEGWSFTPAE